jgi:hypothetical protein
MRQVKENRNCPYCLSPVEPGEERVRCPKCGVIHHADCWKANGSCSVYGCDGWAVWSSQISEKLAPAAEGALEVTGSEPAASGRQATLCIKCGQPVRRNQLVCWKCRHATGEVHYLENCFGPAVVALIGVAGVVSLVVKAVL